MPSNRVLLGLSLGHHRIVLAGAGKVATRRVQLLLDSGAQSITVVAPQATDAIRELATKGRITWKEQEVRRDDLIDATMVIIATNNALANSQVAGWAGDLRIPLVNHAGHHEQGNTVFPPNCKGTNWQYAVHGGDGGPVFALYVMNHFEKVAREHGFNVLSQVAQQVREACYSAGHTQAETSAQIQKALDNPEVQTAAQRGDLASALEIAKTL